MNTTSKLIACGLLGFVLAGCDVDKTEEGEAPSVDVDVQAEEGSLPSYNVETPDVNVTSEEKTVTVPDVEVQTEERQVEVPSVDIDVPEENENTVDEPAVETPQN